jgi:hypothetical protein
MLKIKFYINKIINLFTFLRNRFCMIVYHLSSAFQYLIGIRNFERIKKLLKLLIQFKYIKYILQLLALFNLIMGGSIILAYTDFLYNINDGFKILLNIYKDIFYNIIDFFNQSFYRVFSYINSFFKKLLNLFKIEKIEIEIKDNKLDNIKENKPKYKELPLLYIAISLLTLGIIIIAYDYSHNIDNGNETFNNIKQWLSTNFVLYGGYRVYNQLDNFIRDTGYDYIKNLIKSFFETSDISDTQSIYSDRTSSDIFIEDNRTNNNNNNNNDNDNDLNHLSSNDRNNYNKYFKKLPVDHTLPNPWDVESDYDSDSSTHSDKTIKNNN